MLASGSSTTFSICSPQGMDHALLAEAISIIIALNGCGLISWVWFLVREPNGILRILYDVVCFCGEWLGAKVHIQVLSNSQNAECSPSHLSQRKAESGYWHSGM